jgi:hypothetical protein
VEVQVVVIEGDAVYDKQRGMLVFWFSFFFCLGGDCVGVGVFSYFWDFGGEVWLTGWLLAAEEE